MNSFIKYCCHSINLSILDFKFARQLILSIFRTAINLSILDFKYGAIIIQATNTTL